MLFVYQYVSTGFQIKVPLAYCVNNSFHKQIFCNLYYISVCRYGFYYQRFHVIIIYFFLYFLIVCITCRWQRVVDVNVSKQLAPVAKNFLPILRQNNHTTICLRHKKKNNKCDVLYKTVFIVAFTSTKINYYVANKCVVQAAGSQECWFIKFIAQTTFL